jgi:hypothetical protein
VLKINGIEKLIIDGPGAVLNFEQKTRPAMIVSCDGLAVRGLTVDWPRPPFSQGEVVSTDQGGRAADIKIDDEFPVDGSEKVEAITTHERGTVRMTVRGIDAYDVVENVKLIEHQRLRLMLKRPLPLHLGDVVVLRHQVYHTDVFWVNGCRDVRFEGVTVYAAPGMALLAEASTNITIDHFRIEPRPGTRRLMSTCADGLHIASCRGQIDIRNCYLAGLGDDCINVHGRELEVVERINGRTVLVDRSDHIPFRAFNLALPGDRVEFLDHRSLASLGESEVVQAEGGANERLRLSDDLPPALAPGDLLCNIGEVAQVTISDCQFPGNRARAILTHRNTVIERCSFADQLYEAILVLFDNTNAENGPTLGNVTISHNEFRGTGRAQLPHGAIRVESRAVKPDRSVEPVSSISGREIKIVENRFVDSGESAIEIGETRDIVIAGNHINGRKGPAIVLQNVRSVTIDDNLCEPPAHLILSDTPAKEVSMRGNRGLVTT